MSLLGGHDRWLGRRNPGREETASWLDTIDGDERTAWDGGTAS